MPSSPSEKAGASLAESLRLYAEMLRIRRFEEELEKLVSRGTIGGTTHLCLGQEAIPVGVSSCLDPGDLIVSTHRGHGHLLAKGGRADLLLAEIAGRETGYCKGKGGSQHVAVPEIGHMGSNGITGGGIPVAIGLALGQKLSGTGRCVVSYIGDGAANTGNFHESLNLAALWKLPVVFVLENNGFAMSTPVERSSACAAYVDWAGRYKGMEVRRIDGNDVGLVKESFAVLARRARRLEGPALLECVTWRQSGHSKSDARVYRTREEEERWKEKDPLLVLEKKEGLEAGDLARVRAEVEAEIAEARDFALSSRAGGLELALDHLDIPEVEPGPAPCRMGKGTRTSFTEALRETLRGEMERDPRVLLIGEDIGVYGGAFGVSRGLLEEFGEERVRETPISESSFVGLGVGAAVSGLRPVVELMFGDFLACCMDSLVNHAAKFRYMYADALRVPLTLRMPVGRRRGYGGTHSQSLEALALHVPGLQVLFPSTLPDAVGLLRTAIRSEVPVLFLEHKLLYPETGTMPAPDHLVPFGRARLDREGSELTIVTYGHALGYVREAAGHLETRGHSAEVLDLRSLAPFDKTAVVRSVRKTGRLLCVQEATPVAGLSDRLIAAILPEVFGHLHAPPSRLGGEHCPMPASPALEDLVMPDARKVLRAALHLLRDY